MLDYFQLVIIVQQWFYCNSFQPPNSSPIVISHYAFMKLEKICQKRLFFFICNCRLEACVFRLNSAHMHMTHAAECIQTHSRAADGAFLAPITQETIPFTTVAFSFYGFLLMCSLVFLCWASSPRRLWSGENCLCLLQHTSKRALLRKGKVLRELADCLPIMHHCLLDRTIFREIYGAVGMDNTLAPTMLSHWPKKGHLFDQKGVKSVFKQHFWNTVFAS